MELKQYFSVLWKWGWLIVLATLVAGGSIYWRNQQMPELYQSSTTLMIGRFIDDPDPNNQDFQITQQLAATYAQMVRTQTILQGAVEALDMNVPWRTLRQRVSANTVVDTQLLTVSVIDSNPTRAKRLADEIAQQLILHSPTTPGQEEQQNREFVSRQLAELETKIEEAEAEIEELEKSLTLETSALGIQNVEDQINALETKIDLWQTNYANLLMSYDGGSTNYLSIVAPAEVSNQPIGPRIWYNVALAAAFGFLLASGGAFFLEYINDTVTGKEDGPRVLNLPTLATIVRFGRIKNPQDGLITLDDPSAPASEAYRYLRTSILFSGLVNSPSSLLITSADIGAGKTTTAANLAITLARTGKNVILVDADLRRPNIHRVFEVVNGVGLSNLLLDETCDVKSALQTTELSKLKVLPSGPLPSFPAELVMSETMKMRFDQLQELADIIIFDSPPVLAVSDAITLSTLCDGCILVIEAGRTRNDAAKRSKEALDRVGAKILGIALNKTSTGQAGYYYQYSYLADKDMPTVQEERVS